MDTHRWLVFLLLARLLLGLAYSIAIPAGEAPDEADHLAYAAYIAQERRLPAGAEMTQAKHPPLYHVLAAAVGGPVGLDTGFLRANPDVGFTPDASPNFFVHTTLEDWPWRDGPLAMRLARLVSVLAGVGLVAATYALGRSVWPTQLNLALAAAAFVAFLPESLFIGGALNNDTLAALLGTTALWLALRSRKPWHAAVTGIVMGLGLWAKVSAAALWPVVCLAMAGTGSWKLEAGGWKLEAGSWKLEAGSWKGLVRWRVWSLPIVAGMVALAVTAPWFLRNRLLYGDWMGWPLVLATIDRRTGPFGPAELLWLLRGLFFSFWGKFGGAGHIALPWPFYVFWGLLLVAAGLGWLQQIRKSTNLQPADQPNDRLVPCTLHFAPCTLHFAPCTFTVSLILLGAPLMIFSWLIAYSRVALGTDQGRLLFPAIGPLALLLVGGVWPVLDRLGSAIRHPLLTDHQRRSAVGGRSAHAMLVVWAALLFVIAALALIFGLLLPYAPPPAPAAAEVAAARPVGRMFGGEIELVGYRWAAEAGRPDQQRLTLYWRAARPIAADLRTSLRLLDARGELLWEWKRSPGAGRFSTDRWPVGRPVADAYHIPAELLARAARVEVGVRPFPEGAWLGLEDGAPALDLAGPQL